MTRLRLPKFILALLPYVSMLSFSHAAETPALTTSTEQAPSDELVSVPPEQQIQGEYEGEIVAGGTKYKFGIRVIATGENQYRSVAYFGGLPGSGSESERRTIVTEGKLAEDGSVTFQSERSLTVWKAGELVAKLGSREFAFKRIERRSPTLGKKPPKNALVLFDGSNHDEWKDAKVTEAFLLPGAVTRQAFDNFQMHLEFKVPLEPAKLGKDRGNSGVLIQDAYELQILDSFGLKSKHNQCGGIVGIKRPDANMASPPGVWQTYDIEFKQAKISDRGELLDPPLLSVRHNGVVIHKDVELPIEQDNESKSDPGESARSPVALQAAGSPVLFRNIWVVH